MTLRFEKVKLNTQEVVLLKETLTNLEDNRDYYFYHLKGTEDGDKLTSYLAKHNIPFEIETLVK
jgi:hypothetical protein